MNRIVRLALVAAVAAFGTLAANATPVFNGSLAFTGGTTPNGGQVGTGAAYVQLTNFSIAPVAGSTSAPATYVFAFLNPAAAQAGVPNAEYPSPAPGLLALYPTISPVPGGGPFVGFDPYQPGVISQTITGLTPGYLETVTFYIASSEQVGYNFGAPTTEIFTVGFGSQSASTPVISAAAGTTGPWVAESVTFTANAATQTLSFMANGTPGAEPPFGLLANINLVQTPPSLTPEPASLALLATGLLSAAGMVRSRLRK